MFQVKSEHHHGDGKYNFNQVQCRKHLNSGNKMTKNQTGIHMPFEYRNRIQMFQIKLHSQHLNTGPVFSNYLNSQLFDDQTRPLGTI